MEVDNYRKFKEIIESSNKILVVAHGAPDPDAVACTLFTYNILKYNFPKKEIRSNLENATLRSFSLISDVTEIETKPFVDIFKEFNPDLIISLDQPNLKLLSRNDISETIKEIEEGNVKLVVIDHHEEDQVKRKDLYFNEKTDSCAEIVYKIFVREMGLNKYDNYANTVLLGIIGDTGSFSFINNDTTQMFSIVTELLKDGGNIDTVNLGLARLSLDQVKILQEMLNNIKTNGEYSYSYISSDFYKSNPELTDAQYSIVNKLFSVRYIKAIEDALWGFTLKPIFENTFSLSFRSRMNFIDTTIFTTKFGGGGHKSSSGGIVKAETIEDAIQQVIDIIEKYKNVAYANK